MCQYLPSILITNCMKSICVAPGKARECRMIPFRNLVLSFHSYRSRFALLKKQMPSSDASCLAFSSLGPGHRVTISFWNALRLIQEAHDMVSICVALKGAYKNARTYRFNCILLSFGNDQVNEFFVQL